MLGKVTKRLLHSLLLLLGVSIFAFALLSLAPGNFFDELRMNPQISPATIDSLKLQYALDQPLPVRYARWLASIANGQFGYSMSYRVPVASLLWWRARNTLFLTILAMLLSWTVALAWGTAQALQRGRWIDKSGRLLTVVLLAMPELLIALLLLLLAARTGWFATGGMTSAGAVNAGFLAKLRDLAAHLVLPVVALAVGTIPVLIRHVRIAMIAALESPFIEAARGHGIPKWRLIWRHAFPAASNPLISLLGFSVGALCSLSLLTEVVLGWPGLGSLILEAVLARDVHVVMATIMLSALFLVSGNLLADLLLYWTDPRIRAT